MKYVTKRGKFCEVFDKDKVKIAVRKACEDVYNTLDLWPELLEDIDLVANTVEGKIATVISVSQLQDLIESELWWVMDETVAKTYHAYRLERDKRRKESWKLNSLQQSIWSRKYQYDDETIEQWVERISNGDDRLAKLIRQRKFLFGGRILYGRNIEGKNTYSNCYVLAPPDDNIESIFDTAKHMSRTYSYGGGVGFSISNLRPSSAKVNNSAEVTTGPLSFMKLFSAVTETIGQRGRRGALMLSMKDTHPDLMDFINCKTDLDQVTKANISVEVSDRFMEAVVDNHKWHMEFYVPETGETIKKVENANTIFNQLCKNNWDYAEPGILFWDRIKNWNLMSEYKDFNIVGTNPCSEVPLQAGGSCLLGSLNLSEFVVHPFKPHAYFDMMKFKEAVAVSVLAMNNVLDENIAKHPLLIQRKTAEDYRDIGIGIMGLADMFLKLGVRYGSTTSLSYSDHIAREMLNTAVMTSSRLAQKDGVFPKYDKESTLLSEFFQRNLDPEVQEQVEKYGLRNSRLLSIAPTGTISTFLQVSGGIEPIFASKYTRRTQTLHEGEKVYQVYTPICQEVINNNDGEEPSYLVTAYDIPPLERIQLQAVWQRYVDSAISSTINLPNEATVEDVRNIYIQGWIRGLKGLTVYRSGCKREAILQ